MDGGVPHPRYCWILEFVLSDRGLGVAHPFVFNSHVGETCCGQHMCPWRFVVLGRTCMLNVIYELLYWLLGILTRPFGLTHVFKNLNFFQGSRVAGLQWSLNRRVELQVNWEDFFSSSWPLVNPSILSCKGVFTRNCVFVLVLYYLGPVLALTYLNVRLPEFGLLQQVIVRRLI